MINDNKSQINVSKRIENIGFCTFIIASDVIFEKYFYCTYIYSDKSVIVPIEIVSYIDIFRLFNTILLPTVMINGIN